MLGWRSTFLKDKKKEPKQSRHKIPSRIQTRITGQHKLVVAVLPELLFDLCLHGPPHPQGALRDSVVGLAPRKVCRAREAKHIKANQDRQKILLARKRQIRQQQIPSENIAYGGTTQERP